MIDRHTHKENKMKKRDEQTEKSEWQKLSFVPREHRQLKQTERQNNFRRNAYRERKRKKKNHLHTAKVIGTFDWVEIKYVEVKKWFCFTRVFETVDEDDESEQLTWTRATEKGRFWWSRSKLEIQKLPKNNIPLKSHIKS